MAVSEEFRLFVLDQLGMVTRVQGRRMFGGLGIYAGDFFFALAVAARAGEKKSRRPGRPGSGEVRSPRGRKVRGRGSLGPTRR